MKFALLAVGLLVAWTLLAWQAGWHERDFAIAQRGKFVAVAAFALSLWLAVRARREGAQGGFLRFGEGFETGLRVSVIAAFLSGGWNVFYGQVLNPGWLARAWDWQKAGLLATGVTKEELGRHEAIATASQLPVFQLVLEPIRTAIMGLILSAAIAALLRRKDPNAPEEPR